MKLIVCVLLLGVIASAQAELKESRARQNFQCEQELNDQIKTEFDAAQTYLSMANYFAYDRNALHGFAKMFRHSYSEELEHGNKLIEYGTLRGAKVATPAISKPDDAKWQSMNACQMISHALELEKKVNDKLLKFHDCGDSPKDPQLQDFLEAEYLKEQVDANKELADLITRMERATAHMNPDGKIIALCDGLGLHTIDDELAKKFN